MIKMLLWDKYSFLLCMFGCQVLWGKWETKMLLGLQPRSDRK